jgi:hypothetical protein
MNFEIEGSRERFSEMKNNFPNNASKALEKHQKRDRNK